MSRWVVLVFRSEVWLRSFTGYFLRSGVLTTHCCVLIAQTRSPYFTVLRGAQVVFQKAMKTASVHDLKSDLKNLFINRYLGHGFKLPVLMFSGKLLGCFSC